MTINIPSGHKVGDIINVDGRAYLIKGYTGKTFDHLPGGRGIREVVIEQIADRVMTVGEIKAYHKQGS